MKRLALLPCILALAGCAAQSPFRFEQTIAIVRDRCNSHTAPGARRAAPGYPASEIHEEMSATGDRWTIAFPDHYLDNGGQPVSGVETRVSVIRQKEGGATYEVSSHRPNRMVHGTDEAEREKYWLAELQRALNAPPADFRRIQ